MIKCSVVWKLNKCLISDTDKFITECNWLFQSKFFSCIMRWRYSENLRWSFALLIYFNQIFYADAMRSVRKYNAIFALHGNKMPQLLLNTRTDLKLSLICHSFAPDLILCSWLSQETKGKTPGHTKWWLWFFLKFYFR